MADRTLADEIISIVQSEANNNPPPEKGTITRVYDDGFVDLNTDTGLHRYIEVIGDAVLNNTGVLVFLDGDLKKQVVITKSTTGGGGSVVMVGSFMINNEGHLIVTLPTGTTNPYHIDENGHLIYSTNPQISGGE